MGIEVRKVDMYAKMQAESGREDWDEGVYFFPVFELPGGLGIEDWQGDDRVYNKLRQHSLDFDCYLTEDGAIEEVANAIGAHYYAARINKKLLRDTLSYKQQYALYDILAEGAFGTRIATHVEDKGLLMKAVRRVWEGLEICGH